MIDYVKGGLNTLCRRLQLPGKDQDRLLQIFMSQPRFWQKGGEGRRGRSRFNPELFREKIFFYESFMLFKIHALAEGDRIARSELLAETWIAIGIHSYMQAKMGAAEDAFKRALELHGERLVERWTRSPTSSMMAVC
ncbi:MAG: hypothetical protein HC900_10335 [Methylacidiphilales bacterium]|nr:hypothetical protein [Candidatus Methylacidiphilales bacterium]